MQAGLLVHEEQPPELTPRNLCLERRQREKRWSQAAQLNYVKIFFSSYSAFTCLANFNSTTFSIPKFSCSVIFCIMPCLKMIILKSLRQSYLCYVDDLTIALLYHPYNSLQQILRCKFYLCCKIYLAPTLLHRA